MSNKIKNGFCKCGCGEKTATIRFPSHATKTSAVGEFRDFASKECYYRFGAKNFEERFWAKVKKQGLDECWVWIAAVDGKGYGMIRRNGRLLKAHRVSYELHYGQHPGEFHVCHRCDNPSCVNPAHLWLGTNFDNHLDALRKGTYNRKLTAKKAKEIRALYESGKNQTEIAEIYGIDPSHVSDIVNGKKWFHV